MMPVSPKRVVGDTPAIDAAAKLDGVDLLSNPNSKHEPDLRVVPYWRSECGRATIYLGDNREVMARMEPEQFHAVVCDPPYELGFMGKKWDSTGIAYDEKVWTTALRVAKPGAHLLAFGGMRMWHRMACAIEDATWEIRDMVAWVYGSGFPKGVNVGKAIDKMLGVEREQIRTPMAPDSNVWMDAIGANRPWKETAKQVGYHEHDSDNPASDELRRWHGWNTALKPSIEPVVLARRPLPGTVAECVLENGTGALNIDGCRVGTTGADVTRPIQSKSSSGSGVYQFNSGEAGSQSMQGGYDVTHKDGRWPANLIHDGSEEVVSLFPQTGPSKAAEMELPLTPGNCDGNDHGSKGQSSVRGYTDAGGSAARFFASFPTQKGEWLEELLTGCVKCADGNFALEESQVSIVLTRAVERSTQRLELQSQSVQAQNMNVSETLLRLVCESVTETIQNIERRYLLGLQLEKSTVKLHHAMCVATPNQTGTISITTSLILSSQCVEVATFNIMPRCLERGVQDSRKNRLYYTAKADHTDRQHGRAKGDTLHPTVKPLDLMRYLVRLVCVRGGTVLDPFMGSGSTGCACIEEGMYFVGIEQSKEYADIAVDRLKEFLGVHPIVERVKSTGKRVVKDVPPAPTALR